MLQSGQLVTSWLALEGLSASHSYVLTAVIALAAGDCSTRTSDSRYASRGCCSPKPACTPPKPLRPSRYAGGLPSYCRPLLSAWCSGGMLLSTARSAPLLPSAGGSCTAMPAASAVRADAASPSPPSESLEAARGSDAASKQGTGQHGMRADMDCLLLSMTYLGCTGTLAAVQATGHRQDSHSCCSSDLEWAMGRHCRRGAVTCGGHAGPGGDAGAHISSARQVSAAAALGALLQMFPVTAVQPCFLLLISDCTA